MLVQLVFTIAVALAASAITVYLRDLRHALPILMQIGLLATPIFYGIDQVPHAWQIPYVVMNPMAAVITTYRDTILLRPGPAMAAARPGRHRQPVCLYGSPPGVPSSRARIRRCRLTERSNQPRLEALPRRPRPPPAARPHQRVRQDAWAREVPLGAARHRPRDRTGLVRRARRRQRLGQVDAAQDPHRRHVPARRQQSRWRSARRAARGAGRPPPRPDRPRERPPLRHAPRSHARRRSTAASTRSSTSPTSRTPSTGR